MNRPTWTEYFMGLAFMISSRSHDAETHHGCVIVDSMNRIIATGYNGFPRGMRDEELPNKRPEKYPFCLHSERNAISNMVIRSESPMRAFVTGEPCCPCIMALWQAGITELYHYDGYGSQLLDEETREVKRIFLDHTGMIVQPVKPNLDWLGDTVDYLKVREIVNHVSGT